MRKVKAFWNILSESGRLGRHRGVVAELAGRGGQRVHDRAARVARQLEPARHPVRCGARQVRTSHGRGASPDGPIPRNSTTSSSRSSSRRRTSRSEELTRLFADSRFTDPGKQFHARWVYAKDKTFADAGLAILQNATTPEVFAVYLRARTSCRTTTGATRPTRASQVSPGDERLYGSVVRNYYRVHRRRDRPAT